MRFSNYVTHYQRLAGCSRNRVRTLNIRVTRLARLRQTVTSDRNCCNLVFFLIASLAENADSGMVNNKNRSGPQRMRSATSVSQILDNLAEFSSRPRYAFMILHLLAEQAGPTGKAGPIVTDEDQERLTLREYIGKRLLRMSGRDHRRKQLEARVRVDLASKLPDDLFEAQKMIDREVSERAKAVGADNFSRIVGELESAGYLTRFYEGYRKNHANRGGLRNLVCVLDGDVAAALRRRDQLV